MAYPLNAMKTLCGEIGCLYRENEPMRLHTSFKIGGPADLFLLPESVPQVCRIMRAARDLDIPVHIVGRGSNLLVADSGIRGAVLAVTGLNDAFTLEGEASIRCSAGSPLDLLCRFAMDNGLSGLEFAYGIPGSVGGAVLMNAGAYGGEIKDVLASARHIDREGEAGEFQAEALELSYRHSKYSTGKYCVTSALFRLEHGDPAEIRSRMEELKTRRRQKQPLDMPSAGSTFKRPAGGYASALIDSCGLKGLRVGGAMVSEKHAGFVVNCGGATCSDVLALIERIQKTVLQQTGYRLECEVQML